MLAHHSPAPEIENASRTCRICSVNKAISEFKCRKDRGGKPTTKCKGCHYAELKKYPCRWTPGQRKTYYRQWLLRRPRPCKRCGQQREVGKSVYCAGCRDTAVKAAWKAGRKACKNRRRSRLKGNGGSFTGKQWIELCARYGGRCLGCGVVGGALTADHVVPLSRGGRNDISNIQPLCHGCNVKKADKIADYRGVVWADAR